MIPQDGISDYDYKLIIAPVTQVNSDTPLVGAIVDMRDYLECTYLIATGLVSDADMTSTLLLEESDNADLSSPNAVADPELLPKGTGQEAAAAPAFGSDNVLKTLGYGGIKPFNRLTLTPSGNNSGNLPICVIAKLKKRIRGTTG